MPRRDRDDPITLKKLLERLVRIVFPPVPPPPTSGEEIVFAIDADKIPEGLEYPFGTYANILLRPVPRRGVKDSPINLNRNEVEAIQNILGRDQDPVAFARKWNWVVGSDHTRAIYKQDDETGRISVASISAWYSNSKGGSINQFKVLEQRGSWLKVVTLMAGSDWWKRDIPEYCLQCVWSMDKGGKIIENPSGAGKVKLPLVTRLGYGWIELAQTR